MKNHLRKWFSFFLPTFRQVYKNSLNCSHFFSGFWCTVHTTILLAIGFLASKNGHCQFTEVIIPASDFDQTVYAAPYDIEIDKNGVLVMAGSSGAYSFDGDRVKTFLNKTTHPIYTSLYKDFHSNVWSKGMDGEFHKLYSDSALAYKYNLDFQYRLQPTLETAWGDSSGRWYFAPRGMGYFVVGQNGRCEDEFYNEDLHGFFVTRLEDGTLFHFSNYNKDSIDQNVDLRLYYLHSEDSIVELAKGSAPQAQYESTALAHLDGSMTLSMGNNDLFHFTTDSILSYKHFPQKVIKLFEDSRNQLWVGSVNGLYKMDVELQQDPICVLFDDVSAVVAEDFDGGLWIKSQNLAFGYIPPARSVAINQLSGSSFCNGVSSITTDSAKVYCLSKSAKATNTIDVVEGEQVSSLFLPNRNSQDYPYRIYYDKNSRMLWAIYSHKVASWDGQKWTVISVFEPGQVHPNITDIASWNKDTLVGVAGNKIFTVAHGQILAPPKALEKLHNIKSIAIDSSKTIWLAAGNGLWQYTRGTATRPSQTPKTVHEAPCSRVLFVKGKIWVAIPTQGFFAIGEDGIRPVINKQGSRVYCSYPTVGPDERIWALSTPLNGEVHSIEHIGNSINVERFKNILEPNFEMSWQAMAVTTNHCFFGTSRGLHREDISHMNRIHLLTKPFIQEIQINHEKQPLLDRYELRYDQNSLLLKFGVANFQRRPLLFRSRLLGHDSTWVESEYSSIQYTNLSSGQFTFQIQSSVRNAEWGPIQYCTFLIEAPYYETWWFQVLFVMALLSIGGAVIFIWLSAKEKRNELIISRLRAEQTALQVQMNPHFIFNALSAIQELVYNHSKAEALENISLFARLVRQILELSRFDLIQLDKEINLLRDYLEIESMRFERGFNFRIEVVKGLEPKDCIIPPMLLQPLVENSIKHGLLNSKVKGGVVHIKFQLIVDRLECIIEDNGIGLEKSIELNNQGKKAHQSFALESIKQRIHLINLEGSQKISFKIESFQEECNTGTRITLSIQQKFNNG